MIWSVHIFLHSAQGHALCWTLLHTVWECVLLAGVLVVALQLLRPEWSRARYAAACLILLAMPVASFLTYALLLPEHVVAVASRAQSVPAAVIYSANNPIPERVWHRLPWLLPLWAFGVVCFLARSVVGWYLARRMGAVGSCLAAAPWQRRVRELCSRMRVSGTVALLESCCTEIPVLVGYLRPMILLPVGYLANLPADQVELILLHELAHVRRHDYLVNILQHLVEGLLFFHPAVWWVSNVVRTERENCCDDAVVAVTGDARRYAHTLALLERRRSIAPVLAASGGNVVLRIRRLLRQPQPARASLPPARAAALILLFGTIALSAWSVREPAPAPPSVPPTVAGVALQVHVGQAARTTQAFPAPRVFSSNDPRPVTVTVGEAESVDTRTKEQWLVVRPATAGRATERDSRQTKLPERTVSIEVPLEAGQFEITELLSGGPAQRNLQHRDSAANQASFLRSISLAPGAYHLSVSLRNKATGVIRASELSFTVE